MEPYTHTIELDVRDYECDLQGIVNNAVYFHYFEHARVSFLRAINIDYAAYARDGIFLIVTRIELDFKTPLRPSDKAVITSQLERISRVRFGFSQEIRRQSDQAVAVTARVVGAAMSTSGRPIIPKDLEAALDKYAKPAAPAGQ